MILTLVLSVLGAVQEPAPAQAPVRFGVVYHVSDSSADAIPGLYRDGRFVPDAGRRALPLRRPLRGTSTSRRVVQVLIDTTNHSEDDEPRFGQSQYRARLTPPSHDPGETVLFWDGTLRAHILSVTHVRITPGVGAVLHAKALELFNLALAEADPGMVADHDHIELSDPVAVRVDSIGLEAISYRLILKKGGGVVDDRAMVFFLYSEPDHQIRFANFGHPEWAPSADHVFAVTPSLFFTIDGDPRAYLLATSWGAWEASDVWIVLDARTGQILTQPLEPLGK